MESWCGQPIVWTVCIGMAYLTLMVAALFVCTFCSSYYLYIIVFRNLRIVFRWKILVFLLILNFSKRSENITEWKLTIYCRGSYIMSRTETFHLCLLNILMFIVTIRVSTYLKQIFYFVKVSTINILSSIILLSDLVKFLVINKIIRCSWYFVHE